MWLTDYRRSYGLELHELGAMVRRAGRRKCPPLFVSDGLLERLEADEKFRTVPKLADLIAEVCGATAAQRDRLVLKRYRGKWQPRRKPGPPPRPPAPAPEPPKAPRGMRPVVALNRAGDVIGRYESIRSACYKLDLCTDFVSRRCHRAVSGDEFRARGITFRFAAEYGRMTPGERRADLAPRMSGYNQRNTGKGRHFCYAVTVIDRAGNAARFASATEAARAVGAGISTVTTHLQEGRGIGPRFYKGCRFVLTAVWDAMDGTAKAALLRQDE